MFIDILVLFSFIMFIPSAIAALRAGRLKLAVGIFAFMALNLVLLFVRHMP